MLVQLIMAEGSVLCGAGVCFFFLRGRGEDFSNDHLAERDRERGERERQTDESGSAASSNLNLNLPSYVDQT